MVLTNQDRAKLHEAIVEYLQKKGCPVAKDVEQHLRETASPTGAGSFLTGETTSLERKWKTLQQLSRRNMELEAQMKELERELREVRDPRAVKTKTKDMLPAEPCLHTFRGHRDTISAVLVHPSDPVVYSASEDGSIRLWDLESKSSWKIVREHLDGVTAMELEPTECKTLASCSSDCTVKLYDAVTLECTRTLYGHEQAVSCLLWVGDDAKTLLSGGRDGVRVWDSGRGSVRHSFAKESWVRCLAIPSSSSSVAAVVGNDEAVALWNWQSPQPTFTVAGIHTNVLHSVCFSNYETDSVLIQNHGSADMKETLKRHERAVRVATETAAPGTQPVLPAYETRFVISAGRDKTIVISDIVSQEVFMTLSIHDNWVRQIALSGNGKCLVSCSDDGTMLVTDLATKRISRKLAAHDNFVTCFALHYGGRPLTVTGSADATLKLWPCS